MSTVTINSEDFEKPMNWEEIQKEIDTPDVERIDVPNTDYTTYQIGDPKLDD